MIRSRKISPPSNSNPSGIMTPIASTPVDYGNSSSESHCDHDNDLEDVLFSENGKESRRLFESHNHGNTSSGCRTCTHRFSRREFLLLASVLLASNLTVGLLVYWFASGSSTMTEGLTTYLMSSCPKDMMEFANWYSDTLDPKRKASFQDLRIDPSRTTNTKVFTPVPEKYFKTFYFDGSKISHPIARALRSRGFRKVDDTDHAHLIYTYSNHADWATELLPWQRFNYIPDLEKWNRKAQFTYWYKDYEESTGKPPSVYVPESYMLTETKQEIEAFRTVLEQQNGKNHPWVHKLSSVNQGKGITILPPNSKRLLGLPDKSLKDLKRKPSGSASEDEDNPASIVQRYICNEMTWDGRKFDVRMYWFVASLDPLIVLYHDGYVRVGNSAYSETSFRDTTSHLTSHTGLGAETKATFWQFGEVLEEQHRANTERHKKSQRYPGGSTPVEHVRNQFKHALGEMIEIFKDESFALPDYRKKHPKLSAENAFNFFCADFILDRDLDVWFIEPQNGCGLDEDYYFRLEMHASLFNGMVDVLEEVGRKQEQNQDLLPLEKSGNWEIVYADGQVYNYDGYERSTNKEGCKVQT